MMVETLGFIGDVLTNGGINYEFGEFKSTPVYPYFVGEFTETEPETEDGLEESSLILVGFSRGSWSDLVKAKEKIKKLLDGKTAILKSNGVAVFYGGSLNTSLDDAELKRIQITLKIKEWRVK